MSYCRFSSGNWKSDIYAYEHCGGFWAVHVAGNRIVGDIPPLPDFGTVTNDEWNKAYRTHREFMDNCSRSTIGLPHDGEMFREPDLESFIARLEYLRTVGYNVPQHAIDRAKDELAESESGLIPTTAGTAK